MPLTDDECPQRRPVTHTAPQSRARPCAGDCGLGALDAARERGRWGIGAEHDQSALGRHILTSAVKRVDQAVFLTALAVRGGTFRAGTDAVFNLKNGGVAVGQINPRAPSAFIRQMTHCGR